MAFISYFPSAGSFFHLLDASDLERAFAPSSPALSDTKNVSRNSHHNDSHNNTKSVTRSFSPRFDVRETRDAYLLDGELPGVKARKLDIEFTDPHTLVVRGTSKRESSSSSSSDTTIDDGSQDQVSDGVSPSSSSSSNLYQATVEDAPDEDNSRAPVAASVQKHNDNNNSNNSNSNNNSKKAIVRAATNTSSPSHRYWITERAVGSFHRAFSFPTRVDEDGVRASLREGILSIVVPKISVAASKKIRVE